MKIIVITVIKKKLLAFLDMSILIGNINSNIKINFIIFSFLFIIIEKAGWL